jgi:hypothetical protein
MARTRRYISRYESIDGMCDPSDTLAGGRYTGALSACGTSDISIPFKKLGWRLGRIVFGVRHDFVVVSGLCPVNFSVDSIALLYTDVCGVLSAPVDPVIMLKLSNSGLPHGVPRVSAWHEVPSVTFPHA